MVAAHSAATPSSYTYTPDLQDTHLCVRCSPRARRWLMLWLNTRRMFPELSLPSRYFGASDGCRYPHTTDLHFPSIAGGQGDGAGGSSKAREGVGHRRAQRGAHDEPSGQDKVACAGDSVGIGVCILDSKASSPGMKHPRRKPICLHRGQCASGSLSSWHGVCQCIFLRLLG